MNGASEAEAVARMATSMTEMVARIALQGTVYMVKVAGRGSMELLAFLAAAAKSNSAGGKEKLATLLKSGSALKVFTFREDQMKDFMGAAKRYGIVYSVVKRDANDKAAGSFDVIVKADDAARMNRIFEKLNYAEVDASVTGSELTGDEKNVADIRDLLSFMMSPAERESENPLEAVEGEYQFTASSVQQNDRESVTEKLKEFKQGLNEKDKQDSAMPAAFINFMLQPEKDEDEYRGLNAGGALSTDLMEDLSAETR